MAKALSERLFFALMLEREAQEKTSDLIDKLRLTHGWRGPEVAPDRRHITLAWLDDHEELPRPLVEGALRTAEKLRFPPFEVELDRVAGTRSAVLFGQAGLSRLRLFHRHLVSDMRHGPLMPYARKAFSPHVTLLYDDCRLPEKTVEPIRWRVRDFALIHSQVGLTRHNLLGHWALV